MTNHLVMRILKIAPLTLALGLGVLTPFPAQAAAVIHCVPALIDASCADGHPTIQDATNHATAGDIVLVGPGTYAGFTIPSGVTVRSLSGKAVTRIADATSQAVAPVPVDGIVVSYGNDVTLEGFEVRSLDRPNTIAVIGARTVLRDNIITGTKTGGRAPVGITVNDVSTNFVAEDNEIFNFSTGVYFNPIVRGTRWARNHFHDNGTALRMGAPEGGFQDNAFLANRFTANGWAVRLGNPNDPTPYAWGGYASQPANGVNYFRRNCFIGNTSGAIFVGTQNVVTQDARGNHFGSPDGATGAGGSGDAVQGAVDASSPDDTCGLTFTESVQNPSFPGGGAPTVLHEGGRYRMWFASGGMLRATESPDAQVWQPTTTVAIPGYTGSFANTSISRVGGALRLFWGNINGTVPYTDPAYYAVLTSSSIDDGVTWTPPTIVTFTGGSYANGKPANDLYGLHVLPKEDGTGLWGYLLSSGRILRMQTTDPTGASGWTGAQTVVGPPFCHTQCVNAMVTRDASGYRLWFSTYQGTNTQDQDAIWTASSVDGLTFVRSLTPVLHADDGVAWRGARTTLPWVVQRGASFDMFFVGRDAGGASGIGVASTKPLPMTILDCEQSSDDPKLIQSVLDQVGNNAVVRLRGVCDLTRVPAAGSAPDGVAAAGLVVPSHARGLTITADDPTSPTTLLGGGTQAGIYVAPGAQDTTITGLRFSGLARPIVVHNATGTTVGAATTPGSLADIGNGNIIDGGPTTDAAILVIGAVPGSGSVSVTAGTESTPRTFATPSGQRLADTKIYGNVITMRPPGARAVGIEAVHRAGGRIVNLDISSNAVGLFAAEMPRPEQMAVRVASTDDATTPRITNVLIRGNNLGRLDQLPNEGLEGAHAAGRSGIVVDRAEAVAVSENLVRTRLSRTPGFDYPGGGIVLGGVASGSVMKNIVSVLADDGTSANDLGAIGLIGRLSRLFGGTAAGPGLSDIAVTHNVVGHELGGIPAGTARGLVLDGASQVTARDNSFRNMRESSVFIGASLRGYGALLTSVAPAASPVTASTICGNWLNTTSTAPADRDKPASQIRFRAAIGSSGNRFPMGHLYTNNANC